MDRRHAKSRPRAPRGATGLAVTTPRPAPQRTNVVDILSHEVRRSFWVCSLPKLSMTSSAEIIIPVVSLRFREELTLPGKKRKRSSKHARAAFDEFYAVEDIVGYGDDARRSAWRLVEKIVDDLANELETSQAVEFQEHLVDAVRELNGSIFSGVNNRSRSHPAFKEELAKSWSRFADGRAVHLELGTWSAWPDDVVDRRVAEDKLGDFVRLDFSADYPVDVVASATSLPFADETIDRISSNSLFEHVAYPHEILRECFRVLRPGGMVITTVPFHFVHHSCPGDYLRYTHEFFEVVCRDLGFSDVITDNISTSGLYFTIHQLAKAAIVDPIHRYASAARKAHLTVLELLATLQGLDDAFYGEGRSFWHSTLMIATKPGLYTTRLDSFDRTRAFTERFLPSLICPATGLPLVEELGELVSLDGSKRYAVKDGIPQLSVIHGFGSSFSRISSSREQLRKHLDLSS